MRSHCFYQFFIKVRMSDEADTITESSILLNPSLSKPKHGKLMKTPDSLLIVAIESGIMNFLLHFYMK